jgi:peptide-methionine (R)-S-oxide reductase
LLTLFIKEQSEVMEKVAKTDQEWRELLTEEQYRVLRQAGTERPFTGQYVDTEDEGTYTCAACGNNLFSSDTKFHSGSGWPSFWDVVSQGNVEVHQDNSHGMQRSEIVCAQCGGHLGHLFPDGPQDKTGQRYCINSAALVFEPEAGE